MAQRRQQSDPDAVPASNESFLQAEARSHRSDLPLCARSYCPSLAESLPASPHDERRRFVPCDQSTTSVSENLYLDSVAAARVFPVRATYFWADNRLTAAVWYRDQDILRSPLCEVQVSTGFFETRPPPPRPGPLS